MKKYCAVAVVLLGTFVLAQAQNVMVKVEDVNDLKPDSAAMGRFGNIVNACSDQDEIDLKNNLTRLNQQVSQLQSYLTALGYDTSVNRYNDYKPIADLKPVFWLSGSYFDGFKQNTNLTREGVVSTTDALNNTIAKTGNVRVAYYHNNMAYIFDKSNSITSNAVVNNKYTFVLVYRFPIVPSGSEGRFFTSTDGNRLFAGWSGRTLQWFVEGWIYNSAVFTTNTVILFGTNDNNLKNLWTHDTQLVSNVYDGANAWGRVVVGRPVQSTNEAATVNVYEAIVFDKVLDNSQRGLVLSVLKKYYGNEV